MAGQLHLVSHERTALRRANEELPMKSFRALSFAAVVLGLSAAACSGPAASQGPASAEQAATAKPEAKGAHRFGHHGPAGLLFAALHAPIDLTSEQRTKIQTLVDDIRPRGDRAGKQAHAQALAAAIRAGSIDPAKLAPPSEQIEAHRASLEKALASLHSTLTPEQRTRLVEAVATHGKDKPWKKHGKHEGKHGKHEGKHGKHEGKHGKHEGKHGKFGGDPATHPMLEGLGLTEAQQQAIRTKLAEERAADDRPTKDQKMRWKAERESKLQSFASATFDAKAFVGDGGFAKRGHGRMLERLAIIVPILTPAQRDALAAKVERGPGHHDDAP
jgi:Spy/CpxP family protein refolding chaperone